VLFPNDLNRSIPLEAVFAFAELEIRRVIPVNDVLQFNGLHEVFAFRAGVPIPSKAHHSATRRTWFEHMCIFVR